MVMKFCPRCRNLLQPSEIRDTSGNWELHLSCLVCKKKIPTNCKVYTLFTRVLNSDFEHKQLDDGEGGYAEDTENTAPSDIPVSNIEQYINTDAVDDPTRPRIHNYACPDCGTNGPEQCAVFYRVPEAASQGSLPLVYICSNCKYWTTKKPITNSEDKKINVN